MSVDAVRPTLANSHMLLHAAKLPYLISRRPILPGACSTRHAGLSSSPEALLCSCVLIEDSGRYAVLSLRLHQRSAACFTAPSDPCAGLCKHAQGSSSIP